MSVKQRGNRWQADVMVGDQRFRKSFSTKDEGALWEIQARQALKLGKQVIMNGDSATSITLRKASERCFDMHWAGGKSDKSYQIMIRVLCRDLGDLILIRDLKTNRIDDYIIELKNRRLSNGTINRRLAALSKILKTAQRQGFLDTLPYLTRQREAQHRTRWLTKKEEHQILDLLSTWGQDLIKDAMIVSVDTGVRFGELGRITPKDVTPKGLFIGVSKNDTSRLIPLTQRARIVLETRGFSKARTENIFPKGKQWHREWWDKMRNHLGLTDVLWHTLRHTTASRLIQGGMGLVHVKAWMGHKALATTLKYAHLSPASLTQGLELLESADVS